MSLYQYLKNLESENEEKTSPPHESIEFPEFSSCLEASHFIFLGIFLLIVLSCWCWRVKQSPQPPKPSLSLSFVFNLQNYFHNPVIGDVHFHQGDQMVPNDDN